MFAYLSKKLSLSHESEIYSLSWNKYTEKVAVGITGTIKVIELNDSHNPRDSRHPDRKAGGNNVVLSNETVKGENATMSSVVNISWNESYQKLTTVDKKGLMIIWKRNAEGQWKEEMINQSEQGQLITDVKWSADGFYLCILIDDGQVIAGTVEGESLWNKKAPGKVPIRAEWSPDARMVLVGTEKGEIMVFQQDGSFTYSIFVQCLNGLVAGPNGEELTNITIPNLPLSSIEWYSAASAASNLSTLLVAYKNGRFQLMKSETDNEPLIIDAGILINEVKWNPKGQLFAISGILRSAEEGPAGVIQFYDNTGTYIRVLKIEKSASVGPLSWSGSGLKLALGVGLSIFLATCKMNYKFCYLPGSKTLVFSLDKENQVDSCIIFFDTARRTFRSKFVRNLLHIAGSDDSCTIVTRYEENPQYSTIMMCNSLGTTTETKYINFNPIYITMNKTFVIIASLEHVYVWQYKLVSNKSNLESGVKKLGIETAFSIGQEPNPQTIYNSDSYQVNEEPDHLEQLTESIASLSCTHNSFLLVTNTGRAKQYVLPFLRVDADLAFAGKPSKVYSSKDGDRLAVIDVENRLTFYTKTGDGDIEKMEYESEKKDVWAFMWSRDSNDQCCFLDKYRLNVWIKGEVTQLVNTDAYLCDFTEMKILTIDLDKVINNFDSENPSNTDQAFYECMIPILKKIKAMLAERNYEEAFKLVAAYNQPFLWEMTAEICLFNLDFEAAERAFVEYNNYAGLKFAQRLQSMDNKLLQKAEIFAFFQKFEEARETLLKAERKDLAVQLMTKIGDYQGLEQVISKGDWDSGLLNRCHRILGSYYKDSLMWKKAAQYFTLCDETDEIIECLYMSKNIEQLSKLIVQLSDPKILIDIGEKLEALNAIDAAAKAYEKAGDPKRGVDTCILNNQWGTAVELAERNNMNQIDALIGKYAKILLDKNRKLEAIELYRRANRNPEAASMLNGLAKELINRNLSPLLIKKLFVLAALEMTNHQQRLHEIAMAGITTNTQKTLDTLITSDINTGVDKSLSNPWKGAEAWHYIILAHKMLYRGSYKAALQAAIRLQEYELELDPKRVYSVIATCAYFAGHFKECSRAIMKLEALPNLTEEDKQRYEYLALSVFKDRSPDPPADIVEFKCPATNCTEVINEYSINCPSCGSNFQSCVASGKPIVTKDYYKCSTCKHKTLMNVIKDFGIKHCVLCHSKLDANKLAQKTGGPAS